MELKEDKDLRGDCRIQVENDSVDILEEIEIEDLTVDGICGVY